MSKRTTLYNASALALVLLLIGGIYACIYMKRTDAINERTLSPEMLSEVNSIHYNGIFAITTDQHLDYTTADTSKINSITSYFSGFDHTDRHYHLRNTEQFCTLYFGTETETYVFDCYFTGKGRMIFICRGIQYFANGMDFSGGAALETHIRRLIDMRSP